MKINDDIKKWLKVVLLGLSLMITIITCSGVWNGVALKAIDSFYGWVAGLDFIASGVVLYFLGNKWVFKKKD